MTPFERAVLAASAWLTDLGRAPIDRQAANRALLELCAQHPDTPIEGVFVPRNDGQLTCDLLLTGPDGHTLAMTAHPDTGAPFGVQLAEPYAASRLLSIDGEGTTVQDALLFLKFEAEDHPSLMQRLLREVLLARAVDREDPHVEDAALQAEADAFRRHEGLHSAQATHAWLQEHGLTIARFESLVHKRAQRRKLLRQICEAGVPAYFEAHRASFDRLSIVRVRAQKRQELEGVLDEAQGLSANLLQLFSSQGPCPRLEVRCHWAFTRDLPEALHNAQVGDWVGPVAEASGYWAAQVMRRELAVLDAETQAAIETCVIETWLTEQQSKVFIRWHWPV